MGLNGSALLEPAGVAVTAMVMGYVAAGVRNWKIALPTALVECPGAVAIAWTVAAELREKEVE